MTTQSPTTVRVAVSELLRFFDERPLESIGHASAITGVLGEDLAAALVRHCLEARGATVTIHPESVTTGNRRGHRLDRWIEVRDGEAHVLYQTEIKSWCAHSFGGRSLAIDAAPDTLATFRIERWERQWDATLATFRAVECRKVVEAMRVPPSLASLPVRPLLCFWEAMHPEGKAEPVFDVAIQSDDFSVVTVFSASNYLRGLAVEALTLDMPGADARMLWLATLVPSWSGEAPAVTDAGTPR